MAFSSSTKSWQISNNDQRRECKAHAVFNRLPNFPDEVRWYVNDVKEDLLRQIRRLREKDQAGLSKEEREFVEMEMEIADITDVLKLEKIFANVEKYILTKNVGMLKGADIKTFMKNGELSKIVKAKEKFAWTATGSTAPNGKTASVLGISDDVLDKLMVKCNADGLLSSWLQVSDENWRRAIEPYIVSRKNEMEQLKRTKPQDGKISILAMEIKKLETDWKL